MRPFVAIVVQTSRLHPAILRAMAWSRQQTKQFKAEGKGDPPHEVSQKRRHYRLRLWLALTNKLYQYVEEVNKVYNTTTQRMIRAQKYSGIALRIMPPMFIQTVQAALEPAAPHEIRRVSNMKAASKQDSVSPTDCPHKTVESYGNPAGRFKSCVVCKKRWKQAQRKDGSHAWRDWGMKGDSKAQTENDPEARLRFSRKGTAESRPRSQPPQQSSAALCPRCDKVLVKSIFEGRIVLGCPDFPSCSEVRPETTRAAKKKDRPISPTSPVSHEDFKMHSPPSPPRKNGSSTDALPSETTRQRQFDDDMTKALQTSLQESMARQFQEIQAQNMESQRKTFEFMYEVRQEAQEALEQGRIERQEQEGSTRRRKHRAAPEAEVPPVVTYPMGFNPMDPAHQHQMMQMQQQQHQQQQMQQAMMQQRMEQQAMLQYQMNQVAALPAVAATSLREPASVPTPLSPELTPDQRLNALLVTASATHQAAGAPLQLEGLAASQQSDAVSHTTASFDLVEASRVDEVASQVSSVLSQDLNSRDL